MTETQKDAKPKRDWLDILSIAVLPIVVAFVGWLVQNVITTQNTGKDYIGIALGILERKDLPEDMQKNRGLREWAVTLLNHYNSEKLDVKTTRELIEGETRIPIVQGVPRMPTFAEIEASSTFSISALSNDKSLRASVNGEGYIEIIQMTGPHMGGSQGVGSSITSPKGLVFSPDNHHFVAFNDRNLIPINSDIIGHGMEIGRVVHIPSGIADVTFTDANIVLVKDRNGNVTKYNMGGEILN